MRLVPAHVSLAFAALVCASGTARAGGGPATDAYDGVRDDVPVDAHGLADLFVQENLNVFSATTVRLRSFDIQSGPPSVGLLHATLAHKPDDVFGFRLDVGVGDMANGYLRYDPASFTNPGLSRGLSYVEQAFVTAVFPVGRGLALDVGKFGTPVGLEENESLLNWNYSRSLLYLLAEPTYHSGARLTLPTSEKFAVSAFWLNGWDTNYLAGNGMRSFGAAVRWNPTEHVEIVADYVGGPERAITHLSDPTLTFRNELDFYATYELSPRIAFATTADYARDAASGGVSWWGVGGYLRVRLLPWLAGALRGEHFADPNGFTSGTIQRLAEVTMTLEARQKAGAFTVIERLEYRRDQSDERVFESASPPQLTHQDTATAAVIAAF